MTKCYIIAGLKGEHVAALAEGLIARGHQVVTCDADEAVACIRGEKPDVALMGGDTLNSGLPAAWLARVPARVVWRHQVVAQAIMDERPTPKALPMRLATHIIGPSRYVVGDTQRRFRLKDKPGLVLPPLLPDADSVREPEARLIVFQGPLVRSKGGDVAIRAIQLVDAKLAVVGQGPERPSLEALASELDVSCEFTRTPQLHRAAVAVVPSREEPFGMAAVEAMRAGVPVVATFAGGLPETVGEAGVLVEESNAYALAEALRDMLDDPALAAGFAERGRMRFKTRYALASRLEEQLDAIEALSS